MKLFYSNASPYSRKVKLVIIEKGLKESIEEQLCNPFDELPELKAANPLAKVPTLVINEGFALYDSPVICKYINSLVPEKQLIPTHGMDRWRILRCEALADGIMDAAYNIVMERRRSPNLQSLSASQSWQKNIIDAVKQAEVDIDDLPSSLSLAQLSLGAALGYLEFRLPELDWKSSRVKLATWYEALSKRSSMIETHPK